MTENKKVKHANPHEYNGIDFKSQLEIDTYIALVSEGFNPEYEKTTYHLTKSKRFSIPIYDFHGDRKLHKKVWGLNLYKVQDIKYTPDFTFKINGIDVFVEAKGYPTEKYLYQKKLFFEWLEKNNPDSAFFEIHNKKQLNEAVEIIKNIKQ